MRGEMNRRNLFARLEPMVATLDGSPNPDRFLLGFLYGRLYTTQLPPPSSKWLSASKWDELRRDLAFLKSDLEERPSPAVPRLHPDMDRAILLIRCYAA